MSDKIENLERQMDAAAAALDFETARRLRDRIALMRGGATAEGAESADLSDLTRQQPGKMGLGASQQQVEPPAGWKPPLRPDLLTSGGGSRKR